MDTSVVPYCSINYVIFDTIQASLSATLQSKGLAIALLYSFFFNRYKQTIAEVNLVWRILHRISLKPSASLLCANINSYTGSRCVTTLF